MKIVFAAITLADDAADIPARGCTINGQAAYEAADIVAASRQRFFPRGNESVALAFSTRRVFDTIKEAEVFWATHFSLLPKSGLCTLTCGFGDDTQDVFLANAILTAIPQSTYGGVRVDIAYQIAAPGADTDAPPDLSPGDAMLLRSRINLSAGDTSKAVVFSTPFTSAPAVNATISKPSSAGDNIWATVRDDLTTVNGFTVEFSAPIPAAGYVLNWFAA